VRTHAEHLAHTLNPVPLFERVGHCVPVGTDDKIYKTAYTRIKKSSERFDLLLYKIQRFINSIYYYYYYYYYLSEPVANLFTRGRSCLVSKRKTLTGMAFEPEAF